LPKARPFKLLLYLLLTTLLLGQRMPKPDALTMEDGLGFRDVRAIAQDSRGLMWFGTTQGIERYDGYRFTRYGNDVLADFSFPGGDYITKEDMLMVNDSTLWALSDETLFSLNIRTHKVSNITDAIGTNGKVHTLRQDKAGTAWVVTDDGREQVLLRHEGNRRFRKVATAQHLRMPFNDLAFDPSGHVWWSTTVEGLRLFTPDGELQHAVNPDSFIWDGTKMYFTNISTDQQGNLFIFPKSRNAIWQYEPQKRQYDVIADNLPARVYRCLEDARGNRWFATYDGLLRWRASGEWADLTATLHEVLQFTSIAHIYEDRNHLLWIATDNGLLRFSIGRDMFQNELTVVGADWGNAMRGIVANEEGKVYAYCEKGQEGLHQISTGEEGNRLISPFQDFLAAEPIMRGADNFVFDKKENAAWALNGNLMKINMENDQGQIEGTFDEVSSKWVRNPLCLLRDGKFVFGSKLNKLSRYDPNSSQSIPFFSDETESLPATSTLVIKEDAQQRLWVGTTSEGVFCFDGAGKTLARFSTQTKPALSKNHVLALHFDQKGKLWIGTFGGGLNCLSGNLNELKNLSNQVFTKNEGLSDNNVVSLLEDEEDNIWAGTYNGLSCYRVSEGMFRNFYEEDGLSNNEFNYSSAFKDGRGRMWFGGMNGVNYFDPKQILQAEENPPLCLTGFAKHDDQTDSITTQVIGSESIRRFSLSPHISWVQFNWALPNYFKPDKNQYYVWLEGVDSDWNFIGNTPFVRYNKLPAGDYLLRVKGADSKGNWSAGELAIPITVHPFFYQTWWFFLLVLAMVAGIAYAISRYRLQRLLEMERMRTRIASDLHDEVGSMLSGLAMQAELLEMDATETTRPRIERIGQISRTTVSKMRDLVWSIDSRRDKVRNLLERMQEQAADLLQPQDVSFHFEIGELPLEKKLPVDVRQHLFLIFKEALTNVIRHSNASRVVVRFGNFGGQLEMSIHDNGSTMNKDKLSTGLGLSNMKMRAEKLGAKLQFTRKNGFFVHLTMPPL
jgi:ligand-binding sensor domain-containing protein/two-component sensor histidine kinase